MAWNEMERNGMWNAIDGMKCGRDERNGIELDGMWNKMEWNG